MSVTYETRQKLLLVHRLPYIVNKFPSACAAQKNGRCGGPTRAHTCLFRSGLRCSMASSKCATCLNQGDLLLAEKERFGANALSSVASSFNCSRASLPPPLEPTRERLVAGLFPINEFSFNEEPPICKQDIPDFLRKLSDQS